MASTTHPVEQLSTTSELLHATPHKVRQFDAPPSGRQKPSPVAQVFVSLRGPQTHETPNTIEHTRTANLTRTP
jgi:hypothetical protein